MKTIKIFSGLIVFMLLCILYLASRQAPPVIKYETPAKKQVKSVKIVIYENGCFDAKTSFGAGGTYILRCV